VKPYYARAVVLDYPILAIWQSRGEFAVYMECYTGKFYISAETVTFSLTYSEVPA
jgi:hypothetical protein